MSARTSPSTGRPYGIAPVARAWRMGRASVYRHRASPARSRRRGPVGALPDADLVAEIRTVLTASANLSGRSASHPGTTIPRPSLRGGQPSPHRAFREVLWNGPPLTE